MLSATIFFIIWEKHSFFISISVHAFAQDDAPDNKKIFYRYTTNEGHQVVSHTIPPQYVRNGYEMLTLNGELLKVVAPAPADADADRILKEK